MASRQLRVNGEMGTDADGLRVTYVVMPGTPCQVRYNGGSYTRYVTQRVVSFDAPEQEYGDGFLFRRGRWALRTPRKGVMISHDTTGGGWNEWLE